MNTKSFHITDTLSVTTDVFLSINGIDGLYEILNFMTGDSLFTHQLGRASKECGPFLLKQFPYLASSEMERAVTEVCDSLRSSPRDEASKLLAAWVDKLKSGHYGIEFPEFMDVEPIPPEAHERKGPFLELLEMTGGKKEIHVISTDQ